MIAAWYYDGDGSIAALTNYQKCGLKQHTLRN